MKRTKNMVYRPTTESRELELYVVNCGKMYETIIVPTIENLKKKVAKGIFDKEKAVDSFYRVATVGSDNYYKDFGHKFSVTERFTVATDLVEYYEDMIFEDYWI